METVKDSRALAESMVAIGKSLGKTMRALITRMDQPLGRAVGNAVEVAECVACLKGEGPADLMEVSLELAAEMVLMGKLATDLSDARERCKRTISNGSALERFRMVVAAQGGDPHVMDDLGVLPQPRSKHEIVASRAGFVESLAARPVGHATMLLGAGRARVDSTIDPAVGVILHKKLGDPVEKGEPLCTLLVNKTSSLGEALRMIEHAYSIGDTAISIPELIVERI